MFAGRFIDAHCHLADPRLDGLLDELIARCAEEGIEGFVQGGVDPEDWNRQLELRDRYPGRIFPCFGIHPWRVASTWKSDPLRLQHALDALPGALRRAVALGELGMDLGPRVDPESRDAQLEFFKAQLYISRVAALPLVLHVVRAHGPVLEELERRGPFPRGGLVHSFSGGHAVAERYLQLGFHLSVGGALARRTGYESWKRVLPRLPSGRLVLESDSPDQVPDGFEPLRPGLNDPRCLLRIAQGLSELRAVRTAATGDREMSENLPSKILAESRDRLIQIFQLESWIDHP